MSNLLEIKTKLRAFLKKMGATIAEMIELVSQGLEKNDVQFLDRALAKESLLDDLEKEITGIIIGASKKTDVKSRKQFVLLAQTAQNLERMGDETRSLIERIENKIAEKLSFSDLGLEQYLDVFNRMCRSVKLILDFIEDKETETLAVVLQNGSQIKKIVEQYRKDHLERLTQGICDPRASNLYFDMLDFTGNIARHCTNIARIYKEPK